MGRSSGCALVWQAPKRAAAAEFEASRGTAASIAEAAPAAQADWLWASYAAATQAPDEQRGAFDGVSSELLRCAMAFRE